MVDGRYEHFCKNPNCPVKGLLKRVYIRPDRQFIPFGFYCRHCDTFTRDKDKAPELAR